MSDSGQQGWQQPGGYPPPGGQPDPSGQMGWSSPPAEWGGPAPGWGTVPPPPGAPLSDFGRPLAEWWKRLVALIIDSVILGLPIFGLYGVAFAGVFAGLGDPEEITPGQVETALAGFFGALMLVMLLSFAASLLYYGLLNGSQRGQTLGKMALRIQVRDARTGGPIGIGKGLLRELVVIALGFACGILTLLDGLWPLWDAKRRTWHDMAVGSVVVDAP